MIDIDPFNSRAVIVKFQCDVCGRLLESDEISVPGPDFSAETARDSYTENIEWIICDCGKKFDIAVWVSFAGGYVQIEGLSDYDQVSVEEIPVDPSDEYYIEAILSNTDFFNTFQGEISNIRRLNELEFNDNPGLEKTLKRQLYVGAVACLETYLSDAFIVTTLSQEKYLKAFVNTFHGFKKRKFELSEIFNKLDTIEEVVKQEMSDVIYHKLPQVSGMYKDTLNVNFPELKELLDAVLMRHDLVHRNGKTKDGKEIPVDKEVVTNTTNKIERFISQIDQQLKTNTEMDDIPF